ncbi:unnamed protein product [Rhizophagus irregularis]|nr:unnamed protein product [Rhizophagus irregularis]
MIRGKIERSGQIYDELSQFVLIKTLDQFHETLGHLYKFGPISSHLRPCNVAIKILNHSDDNMENFLNELKAHIKCATTLHTNEFQKYLDEIIRVEICKGKRPNVIEETPECYRELMERCWNPDPSKRPSVIELYNTFKFWYLGKCYRQFKNADRFSTLREVINSDQSDLSSVDMSKEKTNSDQSLSSVSSMSSCKIKTT